MLKSVPQGPEEAKALQAGAVRGGFGEETENRAFRPGSEFSVRAS